MNPLVLVLRLAHILAGVFWLGGSILLAFFIVPAVAATGDAGQKVLVHLVTRARITALIAGAAILTVLAGGALYWIDSQGFTSAWTNSGPGVGFGLGGLFGLIGMVFGLLVGKNTAILGNVAAQVQGMPSSEQLGKIRSAQSQLAYAGPVSTSAMILALICMATARYWRF